MRMVTPPKGEFSALPLNADGRNLAEQWVPQAPVPEGELCRSFGAPVVARLPGRIRISWQDDSILRLEFEAGKQTRLFHFSSPGAAPPESRGEPSWQGFSVADWRHEPQKRGFGPADETTPVPGLGWTLHVVTSHLRPGFLRANGVPYGPHTTLTEYIRRFNAPNGDEWLVFINMVNDPEYLTLPYITTVQFKREATPRWNPWPCEYIPPLQQAPAPGTVREGEIG